MLTRAARDAPRPSLWIFFLVSPTAPGFVAPLLTGGSRTGGLRTVLRHRAPPAAHLRLRPEVGKCEDARDVRAPEQAIMGALTMAMQEGADDARHHRSRRAPEQAIMRALKIFPDDGRAPAVGAPRAVRASTDRRRGRVAG
ncbi:hypothetical protein E2N92_03910 [Methanofollis formosanus]|uniref:Uncharacterized protein n=1 Tax=Methanofollis formosanus TaxID=299308 RepID=A0A8G1EFB1_9EURY|nr:hypothetical protein [Methanofollis formosanus]QYZ78628.1 hypothetical protein E2N92_03910 [Methanofollis formosanus]